MITAGTVVCASRRLSSRFDWLRALLPVLTTGEDGTMLQQNHVLAGDVIRNKERFHQPLFDTKAENGLLREDLLG
jgi:hypothetical protein